MSCCMFAKSSIHCPFFASALRVAVAGLHNLVARSRQDYCSLLHNLALNSERTTVESDSYAATARQKLLATLTSHAVWNVDVQANTFLVRLTCKRCMPHRHRTDCRTRSHSRCCTKADRYRRLAIWWRQESLWPVEQSPTEGAEFGSCLVWRILHDKETPKWDELLGRHMSCAAQFR
jgi:hypothetical protein